MDNLNEKVWRVVPNYEGLPPDWLGDVMAGPPRPVALAPDDVINSGCRPTMSTNVRWEIARRRVT